MTETERLAYSVPEAGRLIGFGRTKAYEEIAAGRLKSVVVGRRRLVTRQALIDFLELLGREACA